MKILAIKLPSAKLDEQKSFYSGKLGFELLNESDNSFTIKTGNSKLTFTHNKDSAENYYHFAFNIPENQLNDAAEWLKQNVTLLEYENSDIIDFPNWNAHSIYFYDAQGNIVEFIARHNLNNASEEKFSANSIINISEVGLPVESVAEFYTELNEKLGLNLWYGNTETFAAIGDEEGLFIAVTTKRNWFPTDKPCNIYPLEIKIQSNKTITIDNPDYKIITEPTNYIP
jgi:catechol-2,3-dioxygenase